MPNEVVMRDMIRAFQLAAVTAFVVLAGCSGSETELTRTERQRRALPPSVQNLMIESEQAYESGGYLQALALTDSVEQFAPDLADIDFLRGGIYTKLSRLDVAEKAYRATLEKDPEYAGAHLNLGILQARQGNLRDAVAEYKMEEELNPHSGLYVEMGRAYAQLGVADSAMMAYEKAVELDSTNASALMWLGQLHEEMGDFETALAYSRRGAALHPEDLDYQYIIGSQLFRSDSVEAALDYLRPVADARPWHHGAQYNAGQALMRLGREDEARNYLADAEQAQQWQQAVNESMEAVERNPDDLQTWLRLAEAHRNAGMYERAIDAMKAAITMQPTNMALQTNLATLLLESGDVDAATRTYQAIVRYDPTLTEAWLNLGVAQGNAGKYAEARQAWLKVLEIEPGNRQAQRYLAQLRQLAGS